MMLETIPGIPAVWQHELHIIKIVSVLIFTVEYLLRLYSAHRPQTALHERTTTWQKRWAI